MPQIINFNGRNSIEPEVLASIQSGNTFPALSADFGKVLIIDLGGGAEYGGGSGINGQFKQNNNSIYQFNDLASFRTWMRGGKHWATAEFLWNPTNNGTGISSLYYVKAATTTYAIIEFPIFTNTGDLTIKTLAEGVGANGVKGMKAWRHSTALPSNLLGSEGDFYQDDRQKDVYQKIGGVYTLVVNANTSARYIAASGVPTGGVGVDGDYYENTATNLFYLKTLGTWNSVSNTTSWSTGVVDPLNGFGADGDYFLQTVSEDIFFKTSGVWDVITNKVGTIWTSGSGVPTGIIDNDYYLNNVNGDIYQRQSGTWVLVTNINSTTSSSSFVQKGFCGQLSSGVIDTNKFIFEFYVGTYRGLDFKGFPYENSESNSSSLKLIQSPEVASIGEFVAWANQNVDFLNWFQPIETTDYTDCLLVSNDLVVYSEIVLSVNGTESYSGSDLTDLLDQITELDYSFIIADDFGDNAQSSANTAILSHIKLSSKYERIMFVGGGYDATKFTQANGSIPTANYFNDESVVVVHSGCKVVKTLDGRTQTREVTTFDHASIIAGRMAGLEPQTSGTYKNTRIVGLVHELKKSERETALLNGVIHQRFIPTKQYVINQSVTSLLNNNYIINPDGSTPEISVKRIKMQLNKELIINGIRFIGGNLNTSSAQSVKLFTEGYLRDRTAKPLKDNLIISFKNVTVTLQQDCWKVSYFFTPNTPINRVFFTGYTLDPNISI